MTDSERANILKDKLTRLENFRSKLSFETKDEFKKLLKEIAPLLDDNQRKRFNVISFFTETNEMTDDILPF